MKPTSPTPITVLYDGSPAAVCTAERVYFAPEIEALPEDHPVRVHVAAKCLVAGAILCGEATGPYNDAEATEAAHLLVDGRSRHFETTVTTGAANGHK